MAIFRKGDQVTITATVKYDYRADDAGDVCLDIDGHYSMVSLPVDKLTMKRPAFKIGDAVLFGDEETGTIVGLSCDLAWVFSDRNAIHNTFHIDQLKYVEPAELAEAA